MLLNFIIVEKLAGSYGRSDARVVSGTEVTISDGRLQIWNSHRDGVLARRPVFTAPVERVMSLKQQAVKSDSRSEQSNLTTIDSDGTVSTQVA